MLEERRAFAQSFLEDRELTWEALQRVVTERQPGVEAVLLTSSCVNGLATPTSDVDLIALTDAEQRLPGMATQIVVKGNRVELVCVHRVGIDALRRSLASAVASTSNTDQMAQAFEEWGSRSGIPAKYVERIALGLDERGEMPFVALVPGLATGYRARALTGAIKSSLWGSVSIVAGEERAPLGYATNALLHACDAVLALHHDLCLNKKWILERWRVFQDGRHEVDGRRDVEAMRVEWVAAMKGEPIDLPRFLTGMARWADQYCDGAGGWCLRLPPDATHGKVMAGAWAMRTGDRTVFLEVDPQSLDQRVLSADDCPLSRDEAIAALSLGRNGLLAITPSAG